MPPHTKSASRRRPASAPVEYSGKRTKTGNSNGFRFEQALFKSHPEFSGEVRAHVIAPGRMLVTAKPLEAPAEDPVLAAFLAFLHKDMLAHPENIRPLDEALMARVADLVKGVEVDMDEDLGEESLL
jgi:hypothetical protein